MEITKVKTKDIIDKELDEVVSVSVPLDPTVSVPGKLRVLCDNSVGSIMNIESGLLNNVEIYVVRLKLDDRAEYAIDYASRLL